MIKRTKLFATVAFPLLSVSLAFEPALAESLKKSFEVAQEESIQAPDGEQVPEELLRKRRKKQQAEEQQQDAQPEQQQAEPEQEKPRRRKQRDAEQQQEAQPEQQQQEAQPAEEQAPREKKRKKREDAERPAAEEQQQEAQPAEEQQETPREKKRRQQRDAEQQQEQQPAAEEQPAQTDDADKATLERRKKAREEKRKREQAEEQKAPAEETKPAGDDDAKAAAERKKAREERRKREQAEEQKAPTEEAKPAGDDDTKADAERKKAREERRKQRDAEQAKPETEGELRPAIDGDENAEGRKPGERRKPRPEVKDTRTEAEKEKIAEDPSKTDETVVLPTDNGAAVLDSDKDADNKGGNEARERRRKQREENRSEVERAEVPKSDAEAQANRRDRRPSREELGEAINERGRRVDRAPEFGLPDLIDAFTGNNRERPRIEEGRNNRTVIDFGDQVIVRSDDRPRLRRDARDTYYEELPRGRTREIIERGDGVRVITIYNRYGDILQRSRVDEDGREYLMIYAPEADEGPRPPMVDVGEDLPPMRLRVPVRDYIIDTSSQPDRDYYDFLAEPPVEQVERTYTIDEVKNSARIRDKVRRIDLDTITFATGSADVPMSQAKTLRKVADAMLEVIDKDPGETFFIEGHTDAVGSDQSNLILSDERAESVASILSDVYDIPPENLVTQGYGERYLKIRTDGPEQENRRVTIRRVTPLVRPVAQN